MSCFWLLCDNSDIQVKQTDFWHFFDVGCRHNCTSFMTLPVFAFNLSNHMAQRLFGTKYIMLMCLFLFFLSGDSVWNSINASICHHMLETEKLEQSTEEWEPWPDCRPYSKVAQMKLVEAAEKEKSASLSILSHSLASFLSVIRTNRSAVRRPEPKKCAPRYTPRRSRVGDGARRQWWRRTYVHTSVWIWIPPTNPSFSSRSPWAFCLSGSKISKYSAVD